MGSQIINTTFSESTAHTRAPQYFCQTNDIKKSASNYNCLGEKTIQRRGKYLHWYSKNILKGNIYKALRKFPAQNKFYVGTVISASL